MKVLFRAETANQHYKEETPGLKKINNIWYAIGKEIDDKYIRPLDAFMAIAEDGTACCKAIEIRLETKAIHFEDMLDSEDSPIFVSLDKENGKGGDICHCRSRYQSITNEQVARYGSHKNFLPWAIEINFENKLYKDFYDNIKVIGIKQ